MCLKTADCLDVGSSQTCRRQLGSREEAALVRGDSRQQEALVAL